jgi:hypothetical protein
LWDVVSEGLISAQTNELEESIAKIVKTNSGFGLSSAHSLPAELSELRQGKKGRQTNFEGIAREGLPSNSDATSSRAAERPPLYEPRANQRWRPLDDVQNRPAIFSRGSGPLAQRPLGTFSH